jgi:hypothetical protein
MSSYTTDCSLEEEEEEEDKKGGEENTSQFSPTQIFTTMVPRLQARVIQ